MKLITPVELPKLPSIDHQQQIMLMGSCFAENIGQWLINSGFNVDSNPFGVLYNPLSINTALLEMLNGKVYEANDLFQFKGLWHSAMHHGSFSSTHLSEAKDNINSRLAIASKYLNGNLDRLLITFGTAYVYYNKETNRVVGNCHKMSEREFERKRISVGEIVETYVPTIHRLLDINPTLKLIFTVSPIRHLRDGLTQNQLSKSTLRLAIDELMHLFPGVVSYFPSYEIMVDELRDYRFYADDLTHPSTLAVEYIKEQFSKCCFSGETEILIKEIEQINRALTHRPLHPNSDEYRLFLEKLKVRINRIVEKYPYLENNFKVIELDI